MFRNAVRLAECVLKPGKSIITNAKITPLEKFSCKLIKTSTGDVSKYTLANLGDASLWLDAAYKAQLPEASLEVQCMFKELNSVEKVFHRPKCALSTNSKLLKELKNMESGEYNSIEEASAKVLDGIGSRVITKSLEKLSAKEINTMVENMVYKNKPLDARQKKLLLDYIYENPIHHSLEQESYLLYREFAQPLVEKRSAEVVEQLTLSILKHRITKGEVTIEELQKQGFTMEFLDRISKEHVLPYDIIKLNNYTGPHGLPEFSDRQIQELYKALNAGRTNEERIIINTAGNSLAEFYPEENIAKMAEEATKKAGYRTAQVNINHCNGARGEIQFRGMKTNEIAEYEHIAYDLREGKNTIGPVFDEYTKVVSKLSDKDYQRYNEYLEKWYNYYNRLELGLPAQKPHLPKGLNKVLSKENLEKLYNENNYLESEMMAHFGPYMKSVA